MWLGEGVAAGEPKLARHRLNLKEGTSRSIEVVRTVIGGYALHHLIDKANRLPRPQRLVVDGNSSRSPHSRFVALHQANANARAAQGIR